MWYLTSDNDDRVIYITPQTQPVIIGRKTDNLVCNFAIPDDASISRKHATLTVNENVLILQDLGSTYGTFVSNSIDKLDMNIKKQLKENDTIKFGKMKSVWKVSNVNLNTCTSTLKGDCLVTLKSTLSKLGASLKNEWDNTCNYLTMPAITLTIKVVLALVQGSYIVTTDFWTNFIESVKNWQVMPDPEKYMPSIMESTLNKEMVTFAPNIHRKSIFKGKKFVFFSRRQYEMYKPVLTKSGASPLLLTECKMTISMLCEDSAIVIQCIVSAATAETQAQRNQINEIITQLKTKGKRVIADAEIGLAILYCSTEKYCNPNFSFTSEVVNQNFEAVTKTPRVLVPETQDSITSMKDEKENIKIDESYASDDKHMDLSREKLNSKRKLDDYSNEVLLNPNKKMATGPVVTNTSNESNKRKLVDHSSTENPSKKMAIENENIDHGSSNSSEDILNDKDKSDEMFNFINPVTKNSGNENKSKKLNLARPQKRKLDVVQDEGDLFNFIQSDNNKASEGNISKQSIFNTQKIKQEVVDTELCRVKRNVTVTPQDISAMRGIKLKELMESNIKCAEASQENTVKIEKPECLEEQMGNLDLGNTVVIVCTNLVVKKEVFKTEEEYDTISVKNFKTFKKIWPVRKQQIIRPSSAMTIPESMEAITDSVVF